MGVSCFPNRLWFTRRWRLEVEIPDPSVLCPTLTQNLPGGPGGGPDQFPRGFAVCAGKQTASMAQTRGAGAEKEEEETMAQLKRMDSVADVL